MRVSKEVSMDGSNQKARCLQCFSVMELDEGGITATHCGRKWWLWRGTWRPDDRPAETVFEKMEKLEPEAA